MWKEKKNGLKLVEDNAQYITGTEQHFFFGYDTLSRIRKFFSKLIRFVVVLIFPPSPPPPMLHLPPSLARHNQLQVAEH